MTPRTALASVSPNVDLLVMGSRGYGPGLAVLLGGVSRRVTMTARCPVLVVPRGSTSALAGLGETRQRHPRPTPARPWRAAPCEP